MVRPTGGRGTSKGVSRPSAQELMRGIATNIFGDEFSGVPVSATKAEFKSMTDAWLDNDVSMDFYNPTQYNNLAGEPYTMDTQLSRQFYEVVELTGDLRVPGYAGPQNEEDSSPAPLTLVPTSTTNPQRPRTVAAGYDEEEEKLTVMFRDGTLYNYYEVDESEWSAFKANRSKGAVIYRMLDFKPRGYADESSMSKGAREAFYRFSRGVQTVKQGKAPGQTKSTYKTAAQKKASRKK
jgi:hypothetical protein